MKHLFHAAMRRPGPTFPSLLAAMVLGLTLALAGVCAHAVPVPEVDPETNPFYKNVPDVSTMSRGDIIREEPAELDDSIFHGATGIRVMYVSVDVDGTTLVPATMMVFYPGTASSPVSDGLWRTMVWATGTVGIGNVCANSRYPYLYQGKIDDVWNGRWKPYGDVAYEMLSDGFITLAPDYVPRYVHYSLHDGVSLATPALVDELCANGNHLYLTVSNKHHDQTLQNVPKDLEWFLELFEGQPPRLGDHEQMTGGCNVPE